MSSNKTERDSMDAENKLVVARGWGEMGEIRSGTQSNYQITSQENVKCSQGNTRHNIVISLYGNGY